MLHSILTDQRLVLYAGLYLIFWFFEMRFGAEKGHTLKNKIVNIFYGAVLFITGIVILKFMYSLIPFKPRRLPDRGIGNSILIALLYLILSDFFFYWYHRAQHKFKFLWALHELHHSDTQLNVTSSMRTYWLDRPVQALAITIPVSYIIGFETRALNIYLVIFTVWLFFTHANLKIRFGIFTRILGGPQLHRIHHSSLPQHQDKNIAQFFPVIDILFGTYYHPAPDEFPPTGLAENNTDQSVLTNMVKPFSDWFYLLTRNSKPGKNTD
jgi:sterol desaturase/sphingolipid hydroxylase (fatty acid hydroxylase superfamily)